MPNRISTQNAPKVQQVGAQQIKQSNSQQIGSALQQIKTNPSLAQQFSNTLQQQTGASSAQVGQVFGQGLAGAVAQLSQSTAGAQVGIGLLE
ncbi:hypothetical protein L6R29_23575 [Myxococcota bacterium]|nr:hypothetical protein [Myxococcota bacterium]